MHFIVCCFPADNLVPVIEIFAQLHLRRIVGKFSAYNAFCIACCLSYFNVRQDFSVVLKNRLRHITVNTADHDYDKEYNV